ncbi:MAG: YihY/virulence factor BrkB family protein [Eubacteriales bacterium]|nr:YihY/virulence factor BrkB family protein [Eubacteriales bacterium]
MAKNKSIWLFDFIAKVNQDCIGAYSAQAAFFIIISFFPFLMLLLSLASMLNISAPIMEYFSVDLMPKAVQNMVNSIVNEVYSGGTKSMISIAGILTLWAASKGVTALITGLNSVYGIPETRNFVMVRVLSMIYTILFSIVLIVVIVILVFGKSLYHWLIGSFPWMSDVLTPILSVRTIVAYFSLTLFFWALFIVIPHRRARVFTEIPGAIIASSGWIGFSYLFSYYIDNIGNYSYIYGSLTAVVLFMVWLWFCMFILFVGAEINILLQGRCRLKVICENEYGMSYGEHYKIVHSPFFLYQQNVARRKRIKEMRRQIQIEKENNISKQNDSNEGNE